MRAGAPDVGLTPAQAAAADSGLKAMIPVGSAPGGPAARPFLDHVLHSLAEAGVAEVALALAPHHDDVRAYYRALPVSRIRISFVTQQRPLGTADAVLSGETWAGGEPFIALNSDNLYPLDVLTRLAVAEGPAVPGFARDSLELPLDRAASFALIEADSRGCLRRIVEKPGRAAVEAAGPGALISMNVWRFDRRIFEACRDVPVSQRGERELPEAVGLAASRGVCFQVIPVRAAVLDLSSRTDVAAVARRLEHARVEL